jgi:multicomponent Na+:H+ antiporter subunit E
MRLLWTVRLFLAFLRDLWLSSLQVTRAVLAPRGAASPRFVTVPLAAQRSDVEITLIANYITLTPGTLTVDVSPDRRTLLVHSLLSGDGGAAVRADVRDGIEPRVVRVTRG